MPLSSYDTERIVYIKALIDRDISRHYTIEELSVQAALGRTKLKTGFKLLYKKGIYSYLRQLRMQRAAEWITTTDRPLKAIARLTGFKHYHNFLAAFTKYYGCTPGSLRRQQKRGTWEN